MERADLNQILREYDLGPVVFVDEEPIRPRAVLVQPADGRWLVSRTDKAGEILGSSEHAFASESEALSYVVELLRDEAAARRRAAEVAAEQRRLRRLPPGKPALKKLRATLAEIRQFLVTHHVRPDAGNLGALIELAANDDQDAVEVMLAAARLHRGMLAVPRDGWRDVYIPTRSGALDQKATARLDQLKKRLARQLEPFSQG